MEYGFRCVIASSFADIFLSNCFKNGLLPIVLKEKNIQELFELSSGQSALSLTVDLPEQHLALPDGRRIPFEINANHKRCLIEGLDDIGMTLAHEEAIRAFEAMHRQKQPWLFDKGAASGEGTPGEGGA